MLKSSQRLPTTPSKRQRPQSQPQGPCSSPTTLSLMVVQNHAGSFVKTDREPHLHSFWFVESDVGLRILISNKLPGDVATAVLAPRGNHTLKTTDPTRSTAFAFLQHTRHIPALGTLHLLFPLPGRLLFQRSAWLAHLFPSNVID